MATGFWMPEDRRRLKGGARWRIFSGVWLLYLAPGFATAWTDHTGVDRALRLLLLAAFCYVYVDLIARALTTGPRWLRWGAPTMLAGLRWFADRRRRSNDTGR